MNNPYITVVLTTYNEMPYRLPVALYSLLGQSFQDFEILVYHDGISNESYKLTYVFIKEILELENSKQIPEGKVRFFAEDPQEMAWGYPMRRKALIDAKGSWIVFTNGDNYHTPVYLEYFAREIRANPNAVMVYVSLLHNYARHPAYSVLDCTPNFGSIDMMAMCTRTDIAREIGFTDNTSGADGVFCEAVARAGQCVKVPGSITAAHN